MRRSSTLLVVLVLAGGIALIVSELLSTSPLRVERTANIPEPDRDSEHDVQRPARTSSSLNAPADGAVEAVVDGVEAPAPTPQSQMLAPCPGSDVEIVGECLGQQLRRRFDLEAKDESWAGSTELVILASLTEISAVTTVTALTVECRETVCRLQIAFPDREHVPTQGPPERDTALVSSVLIPMLGRAGLRPLIVPYPRKTDVPERTYYFVRR
jgi:hypothetical protein